MDIATDTHRDPRPFTLDRYPDRYMTLADARHAAGMKQCQGDRRSIQIRKDDELVDLKRY